MIFLKSRFNQSAKADETGFDVTEKWFSLYYRLIE